MCVCVCVCVCVCIRDYGDFLIKAHVYTHAYARIRHTQYIVYI